MSELRLNSVRKVFAGETILHELNLQVSDGEFMVFVGPSGCGKSTTLRLIAGLETLTSGEIWIGGRRADHLPPAERQLAMVFQNYALYPHMTVAENMGFALKVAGQSKASIQEAVGRAAESLHIMHLLGRLPRQLSGGERQRVAIGRAIVRQPKLFLFDEPLSNLDAALRVEMRHELLRLHEAFGTTMVYVTHDQTEAMTLGSRIALFRQGRIEQHGTPLDLYDRPANTFVAQFLGSPAMALLPAAWRGSEVGWQLGGDAGAALLPTGPLSCTAPERVVSLGLRPEAWKVQPQGERGLPVLVRHVEHLGDSMLVHSDLAQGVGSICVRLSAAWPRPLRGEQLTLGIASSDCHGFDASGERV